MTLIKKQGSVSRPKFFEKKGYTLRYHLPADWEDYLLYDLPVDKEVKAQIEECLDYFSLGQCIRVDEPFRGNCEFTAKFTTVSTFYFEERE